MPDINWEKVRINAAISALQGLMENGKISLVLDMAPTMLAKKAVNIADALIAELKKS